MSAAPTRRHALHLIAALGASLSFPAMAQTDAPAAAASSAKAPDTGAAQPFSFETLTAERRSAATQDYVAPAPMPPLPARLDYDLYRNIQFRPDRARWAGNESAFQVHAFHPGWLFRESVELFEVVDGTARPMTFGTEDFFYHNEAAGLFPKDLELPGIAGFRLNYPLNALDVSDELVAFQGASYFRALGRGNAYGLSARGLAIDTALSSGEEFPRFSAFWLERPATNADAVVLYAALDSPSVTGAYRFLIMPGAETKMEVTARLFFRREVDRLGVAPLTSMFLFDEGNHYRFDDYRPQVHDSNGLRIERPDGDVLWRDLNNPREVASSFFEEEGPARFGLYQRDRGFDAYQDIGARYEDRPSVDVEPLGDWGPGYVALFELPTDLEVNDNIVAFWMPKDPVRAGDSREFRYVLHWGAPEPSDDLAHVDQTRTGTGGVSGVASSGDSRKFVVDFKGGALARLDAEADIAPVLNVSNAEVLHQTLLKIPGSDMWRLVMDLRTTPGSTVEMMAHIAGYGRKLSETWLYQWTPDT